jgi:hypothetical protein
MFAGRDFSTTMSTAAQICSGGRAINYGTINIDFSALWHYRCALSILDAERQLAIRSETQEIDAR